MKVLIIEIRPLGEVIIDAHARNAIAIKDYINRSTVHVCKLYSKQSDIENDKEQFDIILFSYASFYFEFQVFERLLNNQKTAKVGWITNEYSLNANTFIRDRSQFTICNFETNRSKHYVFNLNLLLAKKRNPPVVKKWDLCYYGSYRPDREVYFKKYFTQKLILSTSKKNWQRFKILDIKARMTGKFDWTPGRETLNYFQKSLYIEDINTHKQYHHLANRFYESLFCNTEVLFDRDCAGSIEKSGYFIPDAMIVTSPKDFGKSIPASTVEEFLQRNSIQALDERGKMLASLIAWLETIA